MKVILKATEKEQSKRYQTAMEFKKAIQEALEPEPPLSERVMSWVQDNSLTVVAGVAAFAFIVFVIVLLLI